MIQKVFKNSLIYGIAPQIPVLASIIVLPFITPFLTEIDFGVRGIILAYVGAIIVFQSLGLRMVYSNTFFHSPKQFKWAWRQLLGFELIWNAIFQIIVAIVLYFIIPEQASKNRVLIIGLIVIPQLLFGPIAQVTILRFQLEENPIPIAIRSAIFGLLGVAMNFYLIRVLKIGYMGWFWSTFVMMLLGNISYLIPAFKKFKLYPIFNFKWRLIKHSLKVALPAIPHYYSTYLLDSSDRLVMDGLKVTTEDIGKYSMAYSVSGKFSVLGTALGIAIGPTYRRLMKIKENATIRELTFILQTLFYIGTFMIAIWIKEIFNLLFQGHDTSSFITLGVVILMGYNYRPMYLQASVRLIYNEKTNNLWRISLGAGLLNLILNLILIPIYGFKIAAFTTFIALIYMGFSAYFFKEYKQLSKLPYYPILWIVVLSIITSLAVWIVNFSPMSKLFISSGLLIVLSILFFKYKHKLNVL